MYGLHGLLALLRMALRCCLPSAPWLVQPQANATLSRERNEKSVSDRYVGPTASGSKPLCLRLVYRKENSTLLQTELQCVKGEL